jgi:hypothetical protein
MFNLNPLKLSFIDQIKAIVLVYALKLRWVCLYSTKQTKPQNRENVRWCQIKRKGKLSIIKIAMNHLNTKKKNERKIG